VLARRRRRGGRDSCRALGRRAYGRRDAHGACWACLAQCLSALHCRRRARAAGRRAPHSPCAAASRHTGTTPTASPRHRHHRPWAHVQGGRLGRIAHRANHEAQIQRGANRAARINTQSMGYSRQHNRAPTHPGCGAGAAPHPCTWHGSRPCRLASSPCLRSQHRSVLATEEGARKRCGQPSAHPPQTHCRCRVLHRTLLAAPATPRSPRRGACERAGG
jgi:hypothetical protein